MRKRVLLVPLLLLPALAACAAQETGISAYTSDEVGPTGLERNCADLATTGDMYRYCLQVGPQQAILGPESDQHGIATAAAR